MFVQTKGDTSTLTNELFTNNLCESLSLTRVHAHTTIGRAPGPRVFSTVTQTRLDPGGF